MKTQLTTFKIIRETHIADGSCWLDISATFGDPTATPTKEPAYLIFDPVAWLRYKDDAMPHAVKLGLEQQLLSALFWLGRGCTPENRCHIMPDFAPHSFLFRNGLFGGLIYQGPEAPADGSFPSLTVSLTPGVGWFAHT